MLLKELQSLGLSIELIQKDTDEMDITSLDDDLSMDDSGAIPDISLVQDTSEKEIDRELQSLLENTEIADETVEAVETEPSTDELADETTKQ